MNTHDILRKLVPTLQCKPGWSFSIDDSDDPGFLVLVISVCGYNSSTYDAGDRAKFIVRHMQAVPEATYNEQSWLRWIFEKCRGVENHELGEWFRIDNRKPFAPMHGPGEDPYTVHEYRPKRDAQ